MIRGLHAMFYSTDAEATRAMIRDKLQWSFSDVGDVDVDQPQYKKG